MPGRSEYLNMNALAYPTSFTIDGAALGSATATDGTATFSAKSGTIVVAKIGKESVKIAVE